MTETEPMPTADEWHDARTSAAEWHDGMMSALYAFTSSGAIRADLPYAIGDPSDYGAGEDAPDAALFAVGRWVESFTDASAVVITPDTRDDRGTDRPRYPYGADAVRRTDGGETWYAVYNGAEGFAPAVLLVAAWDESDAVAEWCDWRGEPMTADELDEYGADNAYWCDAGGPFDIEQIRCERVAVWPRGDDGQTEQARAAAWRDLMTR